MLLEGPQRMNASQEAPAVIEVQATGVTFLTALGAREHNCTGRLVAQWNYVRDTDNRKIDDKCEHDHRRAPHFLRRSCGG